MAKSTNGRPGRTIQSVKIAFNVLEVIQDRGQIGVTELADELGHSKSTVYSHLKTLEERKMLVREDTGYRLSLRILDMATDVCEQVGNYEVIKNEVDKLARKTGEIAQFGVEEHGAVSYFYKATGEQAVETRSSVGTQAPMYSTSLGKAILAFLPVKRTDEIVQSSTFEQFTPQTVASPDELYADLEPIRERGYALDDEENIVGLRCVAAPVENGDTVLGAVSVTGPSSRFSHDRLHGELSDNVRRAANVIELNTKFS